MRNLRLEIEYDGGNYCGWQVQRSPQSTVRSPRKKSIQEVIEKTLRKILQEKVYLSASGRTDAGVHALAQVANFKTNSFIPRKKLAAALNGLLPEDIKIRGIRETSLDFHSRFAAKSKVYRYLVLNQPYLNVHLRGKVYFYPYPLDLKLVRREALCLLGRHDFRAFCASGSSAKDTIRIIKRVQVVHGSRFTVHGIKKDALIAIEIEANGFLYNMVRNIVGTLLEIGRGKFPPGSLKEILLSRDRKKAGQIAPAHGLYLVKLNY